jgi:hypothetical protein
MTRLPRILLPLALTVACALLAPAGAYAADAVATGTVTGGSLTLTGGTPPTWSVPVSGVDQFPQYDFPLVVTDATGSGAGWNGTVTSTQFTTGGGTPHTLPTSVTTFGGIAPTTCRPSTTCSTISGTNLGSVNVPAGATPPTAVKFRNAFVNTGMGSWDVAPVTITRVPGNSFAGTYSSTFTFAIISGP